MKNANLILLLAIAAAVAPSCKNNEQEVQKTEVGAITLRDTTCLMEYFFPATIKGFQDVAIFPQVTGRIVKVCVIEGQNVKKGDVLFKIDDVSYKASYDAAAADVEVAEAQVATAQLTKDSKERLYKKNVISEYQYKLAVNSLMTAKASLSRAKASLENAANQLSFTNVVAPVNGKIGNLPYKMGSLVGPSITEPLTYVSDNSKIFADFSIQENAYLALLAGHTNDPKWVEKMPPLELVTNNGVRYDQKGRLYSASGMISAETGALPMRSVFPNEKGFLISGGACRVVLSINQEKAILIPRSSIKEIQNKTFVFKIIDGKLAQTEVNASRYNNALWILEANEDGTFPVKAGEQITSTTNRLMDGIEVVIK